MILQKLINYLSKTDDFIKMKNSLSKTDDFMKMINPLSKTDDFTKTHEFINNFTLFYKNS